MSQIKSSPKYKNQVFFFLYNLSKISFIYFLSHGNLTQVKISKNPKKHILLGIFRMLAYLFLRRMHCVNPLRLRAILNKMLVFDSVPRIGFFNPNLLRMAIGLQITSQYKYS